jgi:hypothetical protein
MRGECKSVEGLRECAICAKVCVCVKIPINSEKCACMYICENANRESENARKWIDVSENERNICKLQMCAKMIIMSVKMCSSK